jgi:ribosomal protein S16
MENIVTDIPNLPAETVPVKEASVGLDAIAAKMAAMRNQIAATTQPGTGSTDEAKSEAPVAPQGVEVKDEDPENDTNLNEPEVAEPEAEYVDDGNDEVEAPEEVSYADSSEAEVIDFLEFAETNPNAKFKFMRNGKEIEIDAKKAASILGQGAAISEEARQLKVQKAEFDEYLTNKKAETDGLMLAMEFTVRPQLQRAYDEVIKVQQYQNVFREQLARTQDPVQQAQIQANMQQNDRYLQQMGQTIGKLKPNLEQFYQLRSNQVREILDSNRKQFQDKELRNAAIYDEVRDKISKNWAGAKNQLVPGVDNLDLVTSDEHILSLIRDGLKYRDRPKSKSAGSSIAALTTRKTTSSVPSGRQQDQVSSLREKARGGDTKAADNLLVAQLSALRAQRGTRR